MSGTFLDPRASVSDSLAQVASGHETAESSTDSWMPLMDYAMHHGVSLSTLRRHIKARKIPFRIEGGRYLLPRELVPSDRALSLEPAQSSPAPSLTVSVGREQDLERQLRHAHEEIAELKMLIAIYEETLSGKTSRTV